MLPDNVHVAIKSYKRAGKITALAVFPFAYIWVPESQGDEYKSHYGSDRIITIPDEEDGNLCKKLNAILDRSPCENVLILDDDITKVGCWEEGGRIWLSPGQLADMIVQGFIMAHDLGCHLWGINQNADPLVHYTYRPFSLLAPILGPFNGHILPTKCRFDETINLKEDYDYFLQNIMYYRKCLRFNKYHYVHDHGSLAGGVVSMRTMQKEEDAVMGMRRKWGDKVFRAGGAAGGKSAKGNNILNSFIRVPLNGT